MQAVFVCGVHCQVWLETGQEKSQCQLLSVSIFFQQTLVQPCFRLCWNTGPKHSMKTYRVSVLHWQALLALYCLLLRVTWQINPEITNWCVGRSFVQRQPAISKTEEDIGVQNIFLSLYVMKQDKLLEVIFSSSLTISDDMIIGDKGLH